MVNFNTNHFGHTLRKLLKEHGYMQKDLAEMLGIESATVSAWCRGKKPLPGSVIAMCNIFTVSPDVLLGIKEGLQEEYVTKQEVYDLVGGIVSELCPVSGDGMEPISRVDYERWQGAINVQSKLEEKLKEMPD